ncbi:hypothetical protein [Marilutibacter alkalisoli]|uniref:Uncharacterized protein n=1 Tax=Marilutibacter alkalisoli TaxID=2591633 RepID=A0A514BNL2_9GAMM|nr:hypothetical protein [Lysobacter alkalisoli]QDH68950.1 hypothetical protein FKV23_01650 [Lysobacter alkalisoli]
MIEAIVAIARDAQTVLIPENAAVVLNGSNGQADCKVFLRVDPDGIGPAHRTYLHLRTQAPWYTLEGVNILQWFGPQLVETPVLSVERLR